MAERTADMISVLPTFGTIERELEIMAGTRGRSAGETGSPPVAQAAGESSESSRPISALPVAGGARLAEVPCREGIGDD